jgi:hypothetical protein
MPPEDDEVVVIVPRPMSGVTLLATQEEPCFLAQTT